MQTAPAIEPQENNPRHSFPNPVTNQKHLAYAALVEKGMPKSQAAKVLGYSVGSIGALDKASQTKSQKLSLVSDSRIVKAHKVIDRLMAGKAFGDIESVRSSDALRAAEVVLDRAEPKAQDVKPPTFNFTVYNLDLIKPGRASHSFGPENPPIDVSHQVMSGNDTPEMVGLETSLNIKGNIDSQFDILAITGPNHE